MQRQFRDDDTNKWHYGFGYGIDGDKVVSSTAAYDGANAGLSGTISSGQKNVAIDAASTFANGQLVLIHQTRGTGAGTWELNRIKSGGGTISLVMKENLMNTYTDSGASQAQIVQMKQWRSLVVNSGQAITPPAWDGNKGGIVAFFVKGQGLFTGSVNGIGLGFRGGASAYSGDGSANAAAGTGEGIAGASITSTSSNGNGGGGAQAHGNSPTGYFAAGGGGGSNATSGGSGTGYNTFYTVGAGATPVGNSELTVIDLGGGGGGGAASAQSTTAGNGAIGGAIVMVFAKDIVVVGGMTVNGSSPSASENTGGASAGGSILLKCQTATLGDGLITATGGSATAGGHSTGGAGGDGRIHIDYKKSYTGTTSPELTARQDNSLNGILPSTPSLLLKTN